MAKIKLNSTAKNYLYNTSYQLLTLLVPLITTPYLARVLQPEGIGKYAYAYAIVSYFVLFAMQGLNNYGNRAIARTRDNIDLAAKTFWNIYTLQLLTSSLCIIGYFCFCIFTGRLDPISLYMSLLVVSAGVNINWYFWGQENFKLVTIRNISVKLLTTICLFIFVKNTTDVWKYALIISLGTLLGQLVVWPSLLKQIPFVRPSWELVISHIKPNFILFLPAISVSLYKVLDKIMLGFMTNTAQVGFYESAEKVLEIPLFLVLSFGAVMLPKMSHMFKQGSKEQFQRIITGSILIVFFITAPMIMGMICIAPSFVPIFLGQGYETCIYLLYWLMPSSLFIAVANVVRTQVLLPAGQDMVYLKSCILGALLNIGLNLLLIGSLLSEGAAIATLVAEAAVCIYQIYYARKYINFRFIIPWISVIILGTLFMGIMVLFISALPYNINFRLFIQIFVGVLLYFFFTMITCFYIHKKYKYNLLQLLGKTLSVARK